MITIDGPAASGKSSVSRELARRLGWKWVSTGAFYRGLAFSAQQKKLNLDDIPALVKLAHSHEWSVEPRPENTVVRFEGVDVTEQLNGEGVGAIASKISQIPEVREALLEAQRRCAQGEGGGLVAEGRDCGTVVFPNAVVKVFLTANSEHRAARRAAEQGQDTAQVIEAQKIRDAQDSQRKTAPMAIPENALVVDTTELNLNQVVDKVEEFAKTRLQ